MKKVLLISVSALALSAGAAFAQVTEVTSLSGMPTTGTPAYTNPSVPAGGQSLIQQIGGSNTINAVDQSVTDNTSGNYSEVYQGWTGGTTATNSNASVMQIAASGAQNASRIYQQGDSQTANVTQNTTGAYGFTSTIEQNTGSGNTANVYQGTTGVGAVVASGGATSTVLQTGTNGVVSVTQTGTGSAESTSAVVQSGGGDGKTINVSIAQSGLSTNNSTVWQQSGTAANPSYAGVTQNGSGGTNTSFILQGSLDLTGTDSATVGQTAGAGTTNYSYVQQDGGSTANVTQTALLANNTSSVIQKGLGNSAIVRQH